MTNISTFALVRFAGNVEMSSDRWWRAELPFKISATHVPAVVAKISAIFKNDTTRRYDVTHFNLVSRLYESLATWRSNSKACTYCAPSICIQSQLQQMHIFTLISFIIGTCLAGSNNTAKLTAYYYSLTFLPCYYCCFLLLGTRLAGGKNAAKMTTRYYCLLLLGARLADSYGYAGRLTMQRYSPYHLHCLTPPNLRKRALHDHRSKNAYPRTRYSSSCQPMNVKAKISLVLAIKALSNTFSYTFGHCCSFHNTPLKTFLKSSFCLQ